MSATVNFLNTWQKFKTLHTDALMLELSRFIDEILGVFDVNIDYSPLYVPLCELLGDNTINSLLVSHGLTLAQRLVGEGDRRQVLVPELLPSIAYQILYRYKQQPTDSIIKHCFKALKSATFDVSINFIPSSTSQLIRLLVKIILRNDSTELLDDALALLGNMCRNNLLVQANVKSMDSIRALYSRLMVLLGDAKMGVIVHSLYLFTALCLNEDLGSKLFVGNVRETYQLVINMLTTGDQDTKLYCLNLLIDFTKSETMLSAFVNCQGSLLSDLTNNDLIDGTPSIKDKICELLRHLATKDSDLFEKIRNLFNVENTQSLIQDISNNSTLALLHVLIPDIIQDCQENKDAMISKLIANIDNIPLHSVCAPRYRSVVLSCQCIRILYQGSVCKEEVRSQLLSLPSTVLSWLDSSPNPYQQASQNQFSAEVCRALLEMTTLCVDTGHSEYRLVLAHPHLPSFIGKAVLSDDTTMINTALRLVSLCLDNSDNFAPTVSNILAHNWHVLNSSTDAVRQELNELQQQYADLQRQSSRLEADRCPSPQITHNSQITDLIAQMRDGLQIKDVKSSQLIEIFQEKIAIMATKEDQLNDLVEAKTMALQQSDRLFTQFKNRVAQGEKECSKYRAILQESEQQSEAREDAMCSILKDKNDLIAEVESLKAELGECAKYQDKYTVTCEQLNQIKEKYSQTASINSELSDKLEGLAEEVEMLRVHNDTLKSQHDSDVNQVQVLQKEKQKVVTKLEEKDALYLKTKQSLRQSDDKCRKKDKEKIELESQLAKTKNDLAKTDGKYHELLEQEKVLECKVGEKEKLIETQRLEISGKCEEIEKYSKLMAMFHNLSSDKTTYR